MKNNKLNKQGKNYRHNKNKIDSTLQKTEKVIEGWFNHKIKVKYDQATEISDYKGAKLYACIGEKYKTDHLELVLAKGLVANNQGQEGVKVIAGKLLELKVSSVSGGDARLYTTELHQNSDGDYLAIFNKEGNHNEIKKVISKTKNLKIIQDCDSQYVLEDDITAIILPYHHKNNDNVVNLEGNFYDIDENYS